MGAEATAESGGGGGGGSDPFSPSLVTGSVWQEDTSDFFSKTFSSGTSPSQVIVSTWIQRCELGTEQAILASLGGVISTSSNRLTITAADKLKVHTESGSTTTTQYESDRIFRDIGWYHILLSIDGTASGSDTVKIFVNGDEVALTKIFGSDFTGSLN